MSDTSIFLAAREAPQIPMWCFWSSVLSGGIRVHCWSTGFDYIANADPTSQHPTLIALETDAADIVGKDWYSRLDKSVASSLRTHRKYRGHSVRDLLRAMRNKVSFTYLRKWWHDWWYQRNHYQDLDEVARKNIGELPAGFLDYFTSRNPKLFLHVYRVIKGSELGQESMFESYFTSADLWAWDVCCSSKSSI